MDPQENKSRNDHKDRAPNDTAKDSAEEIRTPDTVFERPGSVWFDRQNYRVNRRLLFFTKHFGRKQISLEVIAVVVTIVMSLAGILVTVIVMPGATKHAVQTLLSFLPLPRADRTKFSVAVARLDRDEDNEAQSDILVALAPLTSTNEFEVLKFNRTLQASDTRELTEGRKAAFEYLRESGADLLIWGTRLKVDGHEIVQLYITPPKGVDQAQQYQLTEDFVLDPAFWGDLSGAIQLLAGC